jgi:conjugal transfer pilus assembly protein TraF
MRKSKFFTTLSFRAFFVISTLFLSVGVANAFSFSKKVCEDYSLGSNWYCKDDKNEKNNIPELPVADDIMKQNIAPEEKAIQLNKLWEVQQKRAVISGEKKDLENVLHTQRLIAKLSTDFAKNMVRLTQTDPRFSKSESYYQNISDEFIEDARRDNALKEAKHRYVVVFIYSTGCPYCERQLPVLLSLKEKYGLSLLGISTDGGMYNGMDQNIVDKTVINDPNIQSFPTIMLLDTKQEKRIFISNGLTAGDQLENLIFRTVLDIENNEKGKKRHAK